MQIKGKTAVVTGGASGLGAATVRALAEKECSVLICDIQEEKGENLAAHLGDHVAFKKTDITRSEDVEGAIDKVQELFGPPRILVNCAGILIGQKIVSERGPHNLDHFQKVIDVNLVGTFNVLRLVAEVMMRNEADSEGERGVIVNTASVAAFEGQIGQSAYSASKAGIAGLTLPAAREFARTGIRVCSIAPGTFNTEMIAGLPDAVKESLAKQVPFPSRLGRPEEFAQLVSAIVENPMLNGEVIRLDGALRMNAR